MKRILDSFIKNIVRQSLNENYGLLNEGSDPKCPPSAFCLNDGSLLRAQKLSKTLSPLGGGPSAAGQKLMRDLAPYCNSLNYGPANEVLATQVVDDIAIQYSGNNPDENKVKRLINRLFFPEWCLVIDLARSKGEAGNTKGDNFWERVEVGGQDYLSIVVNPSLEVFRRTIKKTETLKKDYDEKRSTNKTKWDEELKKSGWATRDEWKKAGWKPKPKEYTIGGGGKNTVGVSFTGLECILDHPALVNTQVKIPRGVGYKLNTGNKTIDFYVYGVAKRDDTTDATDEGVLYREDTGISIPINCDYKFLQHSLSTTPWNYNAVIDNNGKIALTTDPKYNNNIQIESIKGFRHNLLTETDLKIGSKGAEVESIQKKLSVPVTKVFDEKTKAAVIEFQTNMGIVPVTGIVDNKTLKKINDYSVTVTPPSATEWRRDLKIGSVGVDVEAIQKKLNIPTKGGYKVGTENAVKSFQKKYGLLVTGIVDQTTFDKIMSMDAVGTADTYSGQKHNYKEGDWIRITPNDNDNQFSANNGYFRITKIVDSYTVVIEAPLVASGTTGGSTQRVLFGENAKNGTQEVIKGDRNNSGTRSKVSTSTGNVETKTRRDIRNSEYCDSLRKIKKHLNLKVDCKKYQSTLNKIMLALTGGVEIKPVTPVAPVSPVAPVAPITPSGNVTIY